MNRKLQLLETKLSSFQKDNFIIEITERHWNLFREKSEKFSDAESFERIFASMAPWLCFLRLGIPDSEKDNTSLNLSDNLNFLIDETRKILNHITNLDYMKNLVFPIIKKFPALFVNFSKKLGKNKNYIIQIVKKQDLWEVLQHLACEAHVRVINREIETKYSAHPLFRSYSLSKRLKLELSNQSGTGLDTLVEQKLGLKSGFEFHQTLYLIYEILLKNKGIIYVEDLDDKSYKDNILKVLKLISFLEEEVSYSYMLFKERFCKQETFLYDDNSFYTKPLCECKIGNKVAFVCPSPHILLFCINWLFFSCIANKIDDNVIGKAYEMYIKDLLNYSQYNFDDLTTAVTSENKPSKKPLIADFLIETEEFSIPVECKNSLSLRTGFNAVSDFPSMLEKWNRMAKAIHQIEATKKTLKNNKKSVFGLIITNETVTAEPFIFYLYAKKIYTDISLENIRIISTSQFENLIATNSLEKFVKDCQNKLSKNGSQTEYKEMLKAYNLLADLYEFPVNSDCNFWKDEENELFKKSIFTKEELV